MRTRLFVDFWNLQLGICEHVGRNFKLDWRLLSPHLLIAAERYLLRLLLPGLERQ